jgi:uncharacterized protein (TIGR00255 family)
MIISMTGFGKSTRSVKHLSINAEIKSINSKYLEISCRLPIAISERENEIKELISKKISRGKINVAISVDKNSNRNLNLNIQRSVINDYLSLLKQIKNEIKSNEQITLDHILRFSEIFKMDEDDELIKLWKEIKKVFVNSLDNLILVKKREGKIISIDIVARVNGIRSALKKVETESKRNIDLSKEKLISKINSIINDKMQLDNNRLEFELVMLTDRMDITEEIIRANSHIDYFKNCMKNNELSGRSLNFLIQEINREINTIASKSNNSLISQHVIEMKEELEKIKEQLQNVE